MASTDSSSHSLLLGLKARDDAAWTRLVELYAPLVRSWCRYSGVSERSVSDVLQEVFLAVHRAIDRYRPQQESAGLRGWIWTIARNKIHDHFRRLNIEPDARGGSSALVQIQAVADTDLPEEPPSRPDDTTALLRRGLEMVRVEFREATWDAFWRATVLGQSTEQISDETGLSPAAIRQAKSRVLRRLRQQLGDME
ncbi:MAG: sigma-70 family RNA polymerase sigma factor [Planctomycetales bacterium]|nr:sigma-70 family RNA polymerase sigma factor [Planctomycetales bacterium]